MGMKQKVFIFLILVWMSQAVQARDASAFELMLDGFQQLSENEIGFDVLIHHHAGETIALHTAVIHVLFNQDIQGAGIISAASIQHIQASGEPSEDAYEHRIDMEENGRVILTWEHTNPDMAALEIPSGIHVRLGRIKMFSMLDGMRVPFAPLGMGLEIDPQASSVLTGHDKSPTAIQAVKGEAPDKPLASHVFSGSGPWGETVEGQYIHWNTCEKTHPDYAFQLPGQHDNVMITGHAVIPAGEQVSLSADVDGRGGYLTLANNGPREFCLELKVNGLEVEAFLLAEDYSSLPNPSNLSSGSIAHFWTERNNPFLSGTFINWTDQHGNVLGTEQSLENYVMPAADMVITANWTSGSKTATRQPAHGQANSKSAPQQLAHSQTNNPTKNQPGNQKTMHSSSLTLAPGAALSVDYLYNEQEAGALVLQSHQAGDVTGSLIHQHGLVDLTAERYIATWPADQPLHGWHLISAPVQDMAIAPEFIPQGIIPQSIDFYKWDESFVQEHQGQSITGWWINVKSSGSALNPDFETHFAPARGYLLAYGQDMAKEHPGTYGDRVFRFAGEAGTTPIHIEDLTNSGAGHQSGWHLLGNPFTAALDWNKGDWQREHITGGPMAWDETLASYVPVLDIIPAMNGFMLHTGGDGSLRIPPEARVHGQTGWYKQNPHPLIRLTVHDPSTQTAQQTLIRFHPEASQDFDPLLDTPFMPGYAPLLYSLSGQKLLALNNQPATAETPHIDLGFASNGATAFVLGLDEYPPDMNLWLEDMETGQVHHLNQQPEYHFQSAASQPGSTDGAKANPLKANPEPRFRLHLNPGPEIETGTWPVPTISEKLPIHCHGNTLYVYTTAMETSIKVFDIQGRKVFSERIHSAGEHQIALPLKNGVYIVSAASAENTVREIIRLMQP